MEPSKNNLFFSPNSTNVMHLENDQENGKKRLYSEFSESLIQNPSDSQKPLKSRKITIELKVTDSELSLYHQKAIEVLELLDSPHQKRLEAIRNLHTNATRGSAESMFALGDVYRYGKINGQVDLSQACKYYAMAAEKGHVKAKLRLAFMHLHGNGTPVNKPLAAKLYKDMADRGNYAAMYNYANMLLTGDGIPKDDSTGIHYLKQSAEGKYLAAMHGLALCYDNGEGMEVNKKLAFELYEEAANRGHSKSMIQAAKMLESGVGVEVNEGLAFNLYKSAAEKGSLDVRLAEMYFHGCGTPQNKALAAPIYKVLGIKGDYSAMYKYSKMLLIGDDIQENFEIGIQYLKISAQGGFPSALYDLAIRYDEGDGVVENKKLAFKLFQHAANKGLLDINLADMHFYGCGTPQNKPLGASLFKVIADRGDDHFATYRYSRMLLLGDGLPKDVTASIQYLKKSAEGGYPRALYDLAVRYDNGDGVEVNKILASELYRKAADKGHVNAKFNLAMMLFNGEGIPENKPMAAKLYKDLADNGDYEAMDEYALILLSGDGIPKDIPTGIQYLEKSVEGQHPDAMYRLAQYYEIGQHVEENKKLALKLYEEAAELGHSKSMVKAAQMLENGDDGVEPNITAALSYYMKAEKKGEPCADKIEALLQAKLIQESDVCD